MERFSFLPGIGLSTPGCDGLSVKSSDLYVLPQSARRFGDPCGFRERAQSYRNSAAGVAGPMQRFVRPAAVRLPWENEHGAVFHRYVVARFAPKLAQAKNTRRAERDRDNGAAFNEPLDRIAMRPDVIARSGLIPIYKQPIRQRVNVLAAPFHKGKEQVRHGLGTADLPRERIVATKRPLPSRNRHGISAYLDLLWLLRSQLPEGGESLRGG